MAKRSSADEARIDALIQRCETNGEMVRVVVALESGISDPLQALRDIVDHANSDGKVVEAERASKFAPYLKLKADPDLLRLLKASDAVVSILAADEPAFIAPVKRRDA